MTVKGTILVSMILSFISGALNLLISIGGQRMEFPWFLTSISGLITIVAAIFLYLDSKNRKLWGGAILAYSHLGIVAFGLSGGTSLLPSGLLTLALGFIAGALAMSQETAPIIK